MRANLVEINTLRAAAVMAVLAQHWLPPEVRLGLPTGAYGVGVFFVISGFLITRGLLQARDRIDLGEPVAGELRAFYGRRLLRIVPVYYSVLLLALAAGLPEMQRAGAWAFLYLTNVYMGFNGYIGRLTPLWTLAVEMQFYAVWPLIVCLVPRRWILPAIVAMLAIGPLSRGLITLAGGPDTLATMLTPSCLDTLGAGSLLAYAQRSGVALGSRSVLAVGAGGLALLALCIADSPGPGQSLSAISFSGAAMAMIGFSLLAAISRWSGHAVLAPMRLAPVLYVGAISYGIYMFHEFSSLALTPLRLEPPAALAAKLLITLSLAALSWRFLETPLSRLKRFFPYPGMNGEKPAMP